MGCGASTPSPAASNEPPTKPDAKPADAPARAAPTGTTAPSGTVPPPGVELVLLYGIDPKGSASLGQSLADTLTAAGRRCVYLELETLVRDAMASHSSFGAELAATLQAGKILPPEANARLVEEALAEAPAGVYLLHGYPTSERHLKTMCDEIGVAPKLALLLEMSEPTAQKRMQEAGMGEQPAMRKAKSFKITTSPILAELERRSILRKIDASGSAEETLSAAKAVIDSLTRGSGSGGGSGGGGGGNIVLVFGGPGTGAAEQCARLASAKGCLHLSTEALMRAAVEKRTEAGVTIESFVKTGKIVPAHLYIGLLKAQVDGTPGATAIVDGFPKSIDNLVLLEEHMGPCAHAMLLNAADATLEQRLSVPAPGMPPEPAEHVQRRVRTYHNQTLPAIQALEARGVLSRVDANGDADKTFAAFAAAYDTLAL